MYMLLSNHIILIIYIIYYNICKDGCNSLSNFYKKFLQNLIRITVFYHLFIYLL